MSADPEALMLANASFYSAFAAGDLAAMDDVWARDTEVVCIHPGWNLLRGREAVMASWHRILDGEATEISHSEPAAWVRGGMGMVVCLEHVGRLRLVATNVFVIEQGRWTMVHHHASPVMAQRTDLTDDLPSLPN